MSTQDPLAMTGGMRIPTTSMRRRSANQGIVFIGALSFLVHTGAIGGTIAYQNWKPRPRAAMKSIPVELVRLGKPRDPKLLPRLTAPARPPPDEGVNLDTSKDSVPTKTKTKPSKRRDDELSDAARRLLDSAADNRLDSALDRLEEEEPEGSPDGDPMGTTTDASRAANAYQASVIRTMKARYKLPETIPASQRRFLSAEVVLFIERDGRIASYQFTKEHANKLFMAALENMLKSTTLPPPPRELADEYRDVGLGVRFKP